MNVPTWPIEIPSESARRPYAPILGNELLAESGFRYRVLEALPGLLGQPVLKPEPERQNPISRGMIRARTRRVGGADVRSFVPPPLSSG